MGNGDGTRYCCDGGGGSEPLLEKIAVPFTDRPFDLRVAWSGSPGAKVPVTVRYSYSHREPCHEAPACKVTVTESA